MAIFIKFFLIAMALVVLAWLIRGDGTADPDSTAIGGELIDANDARQVAMLVGMTGGEITDVAVARFAIQRFQEQHGRQATTRDVATLVSLMRTYSP